MSGKNIVASAIAIGPAIAIGRLAGRHLSRVSGAVAGYACWMTGEDKQVTQQITATAKEITKLTASIGVGLLTYNAITGLFR